MASSFDQASEILNNWKAEGRSVALQLIGGKNRLFGSASIEAIDRSVLQLGGNGFEVRFDLTMAVFDFSPASDAKFNPLLRITGLQYECVLFPS